MKIRQFKNNIIASLFILILLSVQIPLTLVQAQPQDNNKTEVTIKYDLPLTDSFLVFDLENYHELKPEEVLDKSEWIIATEKPVEKFNKNVFHLTNGKYYLITDSSHELSPIIFKPFGDKQKIVGKKVKENKIEIPINKRKRTPPPPNTFVETNTPSFLKSGLFYLLGSVLAITIFLSLTLLAILKQEKRRNISGTKQQ